MVPSTRLSAEARRLSILRAAIPIFAKKGFNGTTTKMIAQSAGVSEALLYRHFPSKEVIYRELQDICLQRQGSHLRQHQTAQTLHFNPGACGLLFDISHIQR